MNWKDVRVDLGDFAGQDVTIKFNVSMEDSATAETDSSQRVVKAYWSDLFLGSRAQLNNRPNIFLIMMDTLRPDHLSSHGYGRLTSPNIDKLAGEGVRFEHAFSAAPWTDPSIVALFTGLHPSDVWEPKPHSEAIQMVLPAEVETLAEVLSTNGYFTMAASDHPGINASRFGQGFDIYAHLFHDDGPYVRWRETPAEKVLQRLRLLLEGHSGTTLFAYIHLIYPHAPYEPPAPYDGYFGAGTDQMNSENKAAVVNMYDGEIKLADDVVGRFLADIHRLGFVEDSIIIFVSDHGEAFWEHGLFGHGNSLYNELLRIPLIIRAPGRLPAQTIIDEVVRIEDIFPTILDLVDIHTNRHIRGTSLVPLTKGEQKPGRLAFSEFPSKRMIWGRAIQSSTEKLIIPDKDNHVVEYYDLAKDPKEFTDLSNGSSERISELKRVIHNIILHASVERKSYHAQQQKPSEDMLRKLRAIGYVN